MASFVMDLKQLHSDGKKPEFIKTMNSRFHKDMYSYTRLIDASPSFCLCTYCEKTDVMNNVICPIHDKFMRMTQGLEVAAPIFACSEFSEKEELYNYLNYYYDNDVLSSKKLGALIPEIRRKFKEEWEKQKELWDDKTEVVVIE